MTPPGKNCELPGTVLSRYPTSPHVSASATDTRLACATNRAAISSTVMITRSFLSLKTLPAHEPPTQPVRARRYLACGQPTPIERQEPLPMALCRRLAIAPALWKGEAMMHLMVHFDLTGHTCLFEPASQFFDHRQRRERVVLGTGDIKLTRDLTE